MDARRNLGRIALLLLLLTPAAGFAADRDVAGWGPTRWDMTTAALDRLYGERLRQVDPPLAYSDATVGRILPRVGFGGLPYRALFQMDAQGRLQQVLLERRDAQATPAAFRVALEELDRRHGGPDCICDTPATGPETSPVERERIWVLPTTTIHLSWLDYRGGVLRYDPQQDVDPLVPELERRLFARRSLPRRLLIRYHPTARDDLMAGTCRAPAP